MSATPPGAAGALLDQDTPDTIRLSVAEATALGERALRGLGLPDNDVHIIVDQLIDNALCGYPFASLPRLLAGAALARGEVQDYGFLFVVFDPALLMPADQFADQVSQLIDRIKATPRQSGVEETRIPSKRAFRERNRRRVEGLVLERKVVEALTALATA
jgi:LDH2 family malate/lactate/ureidoglycolate dehydrogenase